MYWKLLFASIFHGIFGTIPFSHNTIFNPLETPIRHFINSSIHQRYNIDLSPQTLAWLWSLSTASISIGGMLGALFLGLLVERFGRRNTCVLISNGMFIVGCLLQFFAKDANSVELLILGRLAAGVSVTISCFTPVYLMECAPCENRAVVAMIVSAGFPFWNAIGTVVGMPQLLGNEHNWPISLVILALPSILHLASAPFFPDSPRYLYMTKGSHKKAQKSIRFYHGPQADITQVENEYWSEIEHISYNRISQIGWQHILKARHLRIPFLICIVANIANRMGGIDISNQYSTGSFELLGSSRDQSALYTVIFLQLPNVFVALVGVLITRKVGRRPHLLSMLGTGILAMLYFFVADLPFMGPAGKVCGLVGLVLCEGSYHLGGGSIPKFLPVELCPQTIRSTTVAVLNAISNVVSIMVIILYPPLKETCGPYAVLPLVIFGTIAFIWLFKVLPETQGKKIEELSQLWDKDEIEFGELKSLIGPKTIQKYRAIEYIVQELRKEELEKV